MAHQQPRPRLEPDQLSALWQACDSDDTAPLEELIKTVDPPVHDLTTGLGWAIERNHFKMARYLLERGVPFDGLALRRALRAGSIPVLEMFREFGWDVNMKIEHTTVTAISFAVHDPNLVSYLLKLGANPNLGPAISGAVGHPLAFRLVSNSGTVLQAAASHGTVETFDLLIAHGAVLSNAAVLHCAVENENVDIMARALELGANVNERDSIQTMGWECYGTPLLRGIVTRKTEAVRFLLERGADTTTERFKGENAIEMVKKKWVADEIRKMVEEASVESKFTETEKERGVEEREHLQGSLDV